MPLYEYRCEKCENEFETLVLSSGEKISCPECGSADIEKLFSNFGFKSKSLPVSTYSEDKPSLGCGCTPVSCGCSFKH